MKKLLFMIFASMFVLAAPLLADEYDDLAKEICSVAISTGQAKIAILPFSYLDKRQSQGGSIVSERLTTRIVKLKKYQVIERELLENLMKEQHLETSGVVSAETAKQIGKVLGVDAIISGTLLDIQDGMVEVNARLIKTETAEVVNSGSVSIKKIWSDISNAPPPPTSEQVQQQSEPAPAAQTYQKEEQPVYRKTTSARRVLKMDSYFDIFTGLGGGSGSMNLKISGGRTITGPELGIDLNGSPGYSKYTFNGLDTDGTPPMGLRLTGFGKHWGFDFEMSYYSQTVKKQKTSVTYGNGSTVDFNFNVNDYMKVSVFDLVSMDLLYRVTLAKIIQPYIGVGFGLTLNTVSSPYITQSGGDSLDEFDVGFLVRSPILGVRVAVGDSTTLFVESRSSTNYFNMTRGYTAESDAIALSTTQTVLGIGFKFD